ncbi:MAG: S8 family serine peptidase [Oligoflexia bacterium]
MKLNSGSVSFSVFILAFGFASAANALAGDELLLRAGRFSVPMEKAPLGISTSEVSSVFVAQWPSPLSAELRSGLEARGFEILRYLPQDALVLHASGSPGGARVSAAELGARAVLNLQPEWKLSPERLPERFKASQSAVRQWLLVSVYKPEWRDAVAARVSQIEGVRILRADATDIALAAPPAQLGQIVSIAQVEWVQELPVWTSMDYVAGPAQAVAPADGNPPELTGYESGTRIMGFDAAWTRGFSGSGQVAALADTGVDTGDLATLHPDLKPVVTRGYALGIGGKSWEDPQGHGTHVCGSVGGTGTMSHGALKGGAYEATLLPASIWSPIMDNLGFPSDFRKLFGPPYRDGARIHTNSWGSPRNLGEYDSFSSSVDKYVWENPDFLVLFAAGNSGQDANADGRIDEGSVSSPGTAKNVLTVGASENLLAVGGIQKPVGELRDGATKWSVEPIRSDKLSDNPKGIAAFSSRGPTTDGRLKPEVVAPGTNIVSTRSKHPKASLMWGVYDENYVYAGGTSMATPLTAGAAVVARQYLVDAARVTQPSAALIKATLVHSALDLYPGQYGTGIGQELQSPRPNVHQGYGRVDMDALTQLVGSTVFVDERDGVATGGSREISFSLAPGDGIRATLVYTDAPASPQAGRTLVNNLDLEVVDSTGQITRLGDSVNNTEMLELKPGLARSGDYVIRVVGKNVPQGRGASGKLPYALVVSAFR